MSTPLRATPRADRAAASLLLGAVLALAGCSVSTERAGSPVGGPLPAAGTIAVPPAPPPPAPPPDATAVAPPPPGTQPPTTAPTDAPPATELIVQLDFFTSRYEETGGGLNSQNFWAWDTDQPRAQVATGHGPLAIAEAAEVKVMLYSSFQPRSTSATVTWDVSWSGYMTSFVGADSSAKATITVRVYEIIPGTDTAAIGPTVFERVVVEDGAGAALQGVATLRMNGSDNQSAVLPPLDLDKFYRLEAELKCSSRVAASIGATVCAFADETTSGLKVNSWSIRFDDVPAP